MISTESWVSARSKAGGDKEFDVMVSAGEVMAVDVGETVGESDTVRRPLG